MPQDSCHLIFIHGLAKKPPRDTLTDIWLDAMNKDNPKPEVFGYDNSGLHVQENAAYTLNYWADVFYTDYETDLSSYQEGVDRADHYEDVRRRGVSAEAIVLPKPETDGEARFLEGFLHSTGADTALPDDYEVPAETQQGVAKGLESYALERVPLPLGVKKAIIRKAAIEAYYYLFNKDYKRADGEVFQTRQCIQDRFIADLKSARATAEKLVIISHSMGTMIAYDCLRNRTDCPEVDGFLTLGSPLGIDEVQDQLKAAGAPHVDFPSAKLRGEWVNIFDRLDVVCAADPELANDFLDQGTARVKDVNEQNWSEWRHNITHYLKGPKLRNSVHRLGGF